METYKLQGRKFFDRQMQVFGEKGQAEISQTWVLIHNIGGMHPEVAKNLALLGFNILLWDDTLVKAKDFSANLFFNQSEVEWIGQLKVDCVAKLLRKLNPFISVEIFHPINNGESEDSLTKCSLFLSCPRDFEEFVAKRTQLSKYEGTKFFTFCEYAAGFSFIESRKGEEVKTVDSLDLEDNQKLFCKYTMLHRFAQKFRKQEQFDYNDDEKSFFTFSGIYGSLISQIILNCILENSLSFNFMSYDIFSNEEQPLDDCVLQTLVI